MSFVKNNLATFMDCQDALVAMHNKLTWDENNKALILEKLNMLLQGNLCYISVPFCILLSIL